jgi:hypothetical protein
MISTLTAPHPLIVSRLRAQIVTVRQDNCLLAIDPACLVVGCGNSGCNREKRDAHLIIFAFMSALYFIRLKSAVRRYWSNVL